MSRIPSDDENDFEPILPNLECLEIVTKAFVEGCQEFSIVVEGGKLDTQGKEWQIHFNNVVKIGGKMVRVQGSAGARIAKNEEEAEEWNEADERESDIHSH